MGGFMAKRLIITLSEEATEKYLKASSKIVEAEVNADCEPSGKDLLIQISQLPYDSTGYIGNTELGIAIVKIIEN